MNLTILVAVGLLLLTGCTTHRDARTQPELDRDGDIWTRAHGLRVATSLDQLRNCSSLGVVSERYYDGPPGDPANRPMGASWPEYILRFKTAQLGGDAALLRPAIAKWSGELNESRVLGEAYLCGQAELSTASQSVTR